MASSTFLRLCSRAPRTWTKPVNFWAAPGEEREFSVCCMGVPRRRGRTAGPGPPTFHLRKLCRPGWPVTGPRAAGTRGRGDRAAGRGKSRRASRGGFVMAFRHVVIVGAGPAGATLAYLLARRGVAVTLLEKHPDFTRSF